MTGGGERNGDDPRFVRTGDLTDLSLLPGQFRAFSVEVRDMFERIERRLELLPRIDDAINDLRMRVRELERRQNREDDRRDRERRAATKRRRP